MCTELIHLTKENNLVMPYGEFLTLNHLNEKIEELRKDVNFNNDTTNNRISSVINHQDRLIKVLTERIEELETRFQNLLERVSKMDKELRQTTYLTNMALDRLDKLERGKLQ
jgi:predicted RNase H-like nuclease (RuvC/YqgF family)